MSVGLRMVEVMRALAVLALVCLNFAHAPLASGAPVGEVFTAPDATSFCGSPADDPTDHAPCHACRIGGGADLPPPVPAVAWAPAACVVVFGAAGRPVLYDAMVPQLGARAPPVV